MEELINLSHGSGGEKSEELIKKIFLPYIGNSELNNLSDGATLDIGGKIAYSTDSYVIDPIFFKGGDIGKIAVCGTCNDLLMCGSIPKFLSLAFIIEEGFKICELEKIVKSIADTAYKADVKIVTGDTKVVNKGRGDKIYINTSGIGVVDNRLSLGKNKIEEGDIVIVSGNIGDHGISVMCERENFFESELTSDCACLKDIAEIIFDYGDKVKILRDPTRGGVATTLNEFVEDSLFSIELEEKCLPYSREAIGASEILGIDLLYSANEGKLITIVSQDIAEELVSKLRKTDLGKNAAIIGKVVSYDKGKVLLKSRLGSRRIVGKLSSDIFPRIC